MQSEYLKNLEQKKIKNNVFTFNNYLEGAINIVSKDSLLICNSPFETSSMKMSDRSTNSYLPNKEFELSRRTLYSANDLNFVIKEIIDKGKNDIYSSSKVMKDGNTDALKIRVSCNDELKDITLLGGKGFTSNFED